MLDKYLIGYGERAGSGVPDIYAVWNDAGYVEPTVEETFGNGQPNRTIVTLPLVASLAFSEKRPEKRPEIPSKSKRSAQIEKRLILALDVIRENPHASRAFIAKKLNITDGQAKTIISKLKTKNLIHREGSDTNGKWVID